MKINNHKLVVSLVFVIAAAGVPGFPATASISSITTEVLFSDTFWDGNFDGWTIVDAPGATSGPSDWSVVQAKNSLVLRQNSNIYIDQDYQGTYVYAGQSSWADYHLDVDIAPDDNDGVFVLFRYTDDDNYYRFIMDKQENFRRLEKKVGGVYTALAEDLTSGYKQSRWNNVHIAAVGGTITVSLDHTPIFAVTDSALSTGMIGLGTSASTGCHFDNVVVATTEVDPYADTVVAAHIKTAGNSRADPVLILGRPRGAADTVAIGGPGYWIVLDMGENEEIVDGSGNDLRVYEVGVLLGGVDEEYDIYASNSPTGPWTYLGQGIAVSVFDLAGSGLSTARYVRIEDLSTRTGIPYPGSDIDALQALNMADNPCVTAPTDINWSVVGDDVHLSWSSVNDAVAYNVYTSTSSGLSAVYPVNSVPITVTSYIHTDAAADALYYAITALGPDGCESGFSNQVPYRLFLPLVIRN